MGNKHESTPCSAADFTQIATKLEYLAKRYRELVTQMAENSIASADVTGVKTLTRAIEYLQGSVASATHAVDSAIINSNEYTAAQKKRLRDDIKSGQRELVRRRNATNIDGKGK